MWVWMAVGSLDVSGNPLHTYLGKYIHTYLGQCVGTRSGAAHTQETQDGQSITQGCWVQFAMKPKGTVDEWDPIGEAMDFF